MGLELLHSQIILTFHCQIFISILNLGFLSFLTEINVSDMI